MIKDRLHELKSAVSRWFYAIIEVLRKLIYILQSSDCIDSDSVTIFIDTSSSKSEEKLYDILNKVV